MIEQVSNSVKFLAFFVASKVGKTGLTVTVDAWNPSGTQIVTGAAATEVGGGFYAYTLSSGSTSAVGEYVAVFKTTDTTVDQQHLPALWVIGRAGIADLDATISSRAAGVDYTSARAAKLDNLDAAVSSRPTAAAVTNAVWDEAAANHTAAGSMGQKLNSAGAAVDPLLNSVPGSYASGTAGAALGRIGSGQITTVSPVAQNGNVTIVRGDDYNAADSRALDWTDASAQWPDLTGASILVTVVGLFAKAGSVVVASGAGKKVRLQVAAADTTGKTPNQYAFDVQATLSSGRVVTLVEGVLTLLQDFS